jgi:hypothetical protein
MEVCAMRRRLGFIRFAYVFGAVFDGAMVVPLLVPAVAAKMLGIAGFDPGADYRYAALVGAALMAGWTALLLWGLLRPVERRGVLLLTVVPVVVGLVGAGVYAVQAGLVTLAFMAPVFVFQAAGITVFTIAYLLAPGCANPRAGAALASSQA